MSILVITTGGTIGALAHKDPIRPPEIVDMPPPGQDIVCKALTAEFGVADSRCVSLEPRDSKLIDPTYREKILSLIETAAEPGFLITHGTDTILQTADFLHQHVSTNARFKDKTVVLTGSMIPLANGPQSDGYQNLKFALEQLQTLTAKAAAPKSGVYIVLCDYANPANENSEWAPHLYPFTPGQYEKIYSKDGRYSRLGRMG